LNCAAIPRDLIRASCSSREGRVHGRVAIAQGPASSWRTRSTLFLARSATLSPTLRRSCCAPSRPARGARRRHADGALRRALHRRDEQDLAAEIQAADSARIFLPAHVCPFTSRRAARTRPRRDAVATRSWSSAAPPIPPAKRLSEEARSVLESKPWRATCASCRTSWSRAAVLVRARSCRPAPGTLARGWPVCAARRWVGGEIERRESETIRPRLETANWNVHQAAVGARHRPHPISIARCEVRHQPALIGRRNRGARVGRRNPQRGTNMLRLDTGNTGFMLLCSSLVMLMTPGLAFFYGAGRAQERARDHDPELRLAVLDHRAVVRVRLFAVLLGHVGGVIGNLDMAFLRGVDLMAPSQRQHSAHRHVAYQMMLAIITPRSSPAPSPYRVTSSVLHLPHACGCFWFTSRSSTWCGAVACSRSGRARLRRRHRGAQHPGIAALASVLYVGRLPWQERGGPAQIPLVASAPGLLWFGWYGSIAGMRVPRRRDPRRRAFNQTDLAASFAGMAWFIVEWWSGRKPKFLGLLTARSRGWRRSRLRGLRLPPRCRDHRSPSGVVCFSCRGAQRIGSTGTTRVDVWGVQRRVAGFSCSSCSAFFRDQRRSNRRDRRACWRATARSSSSSAPAVCCRRPWRSGSRSACCGLMSAQRPSRWEQGGRGDRADEAARWRTA